MEKVLLRVTRVATKVGGGEFLNAPQTDAAPGKIKLPQCFHNPDIDRKRRLEAIGKEQNAVRNLDSDTWQLQQLIARRVCGGVAEAK